MVRSIDGTRGSQPPGGGRGRGVPHDLDAEESLLGAMLLSKDAIVEAVQICGPDDFYKPAHGHVFEAVTALYAKGEPADSVTVADELRRAGLLDAIGGQAVLVSLQANTPAIGNAARYARIVEEHALLRRLIGVASEIAELGYDVPDDVGGAIDKAETLVFQLGQRRVADTMAPLRDLLEKSLDHLEALYERGESITGVPTGYADLDERLAGLQPSNLIILGARPSMGKTSFALGLVAHAAMDARTPVLMFSLEMSSHEITQRLLCAEARVDATRMRNGRLLETDWPKISHAIGRLGEAPIFVDDNPNLTIMDIRAKARRLKSREGLGLVVIDYLQLMTGRTSAENRQVEVAEISRGLKILARELEVPVVALSQLSRGLEARADKRPMLADLRESGCMPAGTRLARADGTEITLAELALSQEQPLVWSLDERWRLVPQRLLRAFPSGVKPVFRLRLGSGREVDASANHPFRTVSGWSRLDELVLGDLVAVAPAFSAISGGRARRGGAAGPQVATDRAGATSFHDVDVVPWPGESSITVFAGGAGRAPSTGAARVLQRSGDASAVGAARPPVRCSRDRLRRIGEIVGDQRLVDLGTSDVAWDEVVEIVPLGEMPTFDATVDTTHNFVANGVIAHNSLEQDADVVMFLYRDEIYNPESPERGTAEVILSKHRNGPTGVCHLAFLNQYTRFANMARI